MQAVRGSGASEKNLPEHQRGKGKQRPADRR